MNVKNDNMTELYKRTNCYESGIVIKNAIQNILDYRLVVEANTNEFINKETYKAAFDILYDNCRNSISILNTLASSYNLDLFYCDNLSDQEKVDEFTLGFVVNLCALK